MVFKARRHGLFIHTTFMVTIAVGSLFLFLGTSLASVVSNPPKVGKEITVSALDTDEWLPAVAYNTKQQEYLVVWHTTWTIGSRDVRGARISAAGKVLETFIVYGNPTKDSFQPAVAYDPVNDRYLVAWVFDFFGDGSDYDLYGRFIPWNGPDAAITEFSICSFTTHQWVPRLAYGKTAKEFLVVWNNENQNGSLPMYISGRRITAADGSFPGGASDLTISHATENRVNPDVTYNAAQNQYLVAYDNAVDIFSKRYSGIVASVGGEFTIAGWPAAEIRPSVAACSGADQYMVVWQSDTNNGAIYGRFVTGGGVVGNVVLIDDTTGPEENPDVACESSGNLYTVVWQTEYTNLKYGVWGRVVRPDEQMGTQFAIAHPSSTADRTKPRLAGSAENFLVTWEHGRSGTAYQDISARLVTPYRFPWHMFLPAIITPRP